MIHNIFKENPKLKLDTLDSVEVGKPNPINLFDINSIGWFYNFEGSHVEKFRSIYKK